MDKRAGSRQDTSGHFHAVRFYENKTSLCRTVADFLGEGFTLGDPALVIATLDHRDALLRELRSRGFDPAHLEEDGQLMLLDARTVLAEFMVDGMPDAARFNATVAPAIERACGARKEYTVRAYGEMVDVLWQDGFTAAAIRLEMLWNQLAVTHDFSLLCGYAMGSFYKDAGMRDVCHQHSEVVPADSVLTDRATARVR